jgi:heptosyltransferase I
LSHPLSGSRIAIVRMSALGDVVHVLPVATSLKAAVADVHISWLIQAAPGELIESHPAVDRIIPFDRDATLRSFRRLLEGRASERFDLVLAIQTSVKAGVATALIRAPRKIGFDRDRAPELNWLFTNERIAARARGHVQDEALEFLDHLEVPRHLEWGLEPTEEEVRRFEPLLPAHDGPTVALVVASSLRDKDWPAERYAALADRLHEELSARCIIVGGRSPAELAAVETIRRHARHAPLDLGAWDLRRLVFLLHQADVVVSPDSGPMHISVALGTPTVALMGYTNPNRFGPYRFRELMVDAYGDPDERFSATEGYRPGRMERISSEQVLQRVHGALLHPRLLPPTPAKR